MRTAHIPVLAEELLELLDPQPAQTAIDCTFGGGGHARLVAERLGPEGTLVAIDRDPLAEERFLELAEDLPCSARFLRGGYAEALQMLAEEGLRADIAYLDLGMSSMQIDTRERGFSYSYDAPLDMRMDPRSELTAREIVADWDERRLAGILREFGEERHASAIARAIVRRRTQTPIDTTLALVEVISAAVPAPARFASGHPAKRTFQALRIAVNDELGQLEAALPLAWELLARGRRARGQSPSIRWRTAASSTSSSSVHAVAFARRTYPCVDAGACPRRRCSREAQSCPPRMRRQTTRAPPRLVCGPPPSFQVPSTHPGGQA